MKDNQLTEKVIGAAIEVHRLLGPGLLESIYEQALCHELALRGISTQTQVEVDVVYKDLIIRGQRIDILVEGCLIIELKAVSRLPEVAMAQTLSYLKATGLELALLINFGEKRLVDGVRRVSLLNHCQSAFLFIAGKSHRDHGGHRDGTGEFLRTNRTCSFGTRYGVSLRQESIPLCSL